ncbi:MAG: lipopolysaccharide biosynthesis protein, partial [Muribaculaceae bacterium]|nr:lipopolysaccharide biosynthesis protein [Muribaculaceae bacterium]
MENSSNKRLAKNTLFLYIRMILIMLVSLYTSRIVLEELGVDDYGVYTVVGGVVAMFAFINGSMTSSTQRFLNFELGKGVTPRLSKLFRTALTIHALIGVVMLILAETVGLWFVNAKLVIPADSLIGANVVYQTSVLSFCITIMQVPFNATIIAHEKMSIYAYISIIEVLLKLSIAVSLMIVPTHKLAIYGVLILVVHFITASIYAIYCLRKYSECSLRFCYDRDMFKEMSGFAGWNLCGSIAWIVRLQGMGIILNIFFGPVLNAAKGISDQVAGAVNQLNNNFQVALNPQITKSYAQEKLQEMEVLTYRGIKFSSLLLLVMIVPLSININFILNLWLTTVPDYTPIFVILILADVLSGNLFGSPLMASLSATGKIRN